MRWSWEVWLCRTVQLTADRAIRPEAARSALSDGTLEAGEGGADVLVFIAEEEELIVEVGVHLLVGVVDFLSGACRPEAGGGEPA